jgi:PEGA domain-containing protein
LNNSEIPSQPDDIRRAQLVAAAETLVAWVHERRATWDDIPARVDLTSVSQTYQATAAPPLLDLDSEVPSRSEAPADKGRSWKLPRISLAGPLAVLRSLGTSLQRLGGGVTQLGAGAARLGPAVARVAVIAGIVAAVGVAGWTARPYLMKAITTPKTGTAAFESLPPSEVLVDGVSIGTAPLTADLATGHHVIQFRRSHGVRNMEIDVVGGGTSTTRLDWDAQQTGRLMARSDPPGATVLVDGKDRGVTPLTLEDITLGSHTVVLQSNDGTVRRTVTVTADRAAVVTESIFAGFLKLFAPFELQVTEGTRAIRLDDQHQAMLPPGVHELRFENASLGYSDTRRIEVQPGQTTSLSLVPSPSLLTVVASSASTVIIDGQQVGETPLTNHPVALGTRDIIVRNAAGEERRFTRTVTVAPVSIEVNF